MSDFSYQYPPFLVDSVLLPNTPIKMPSFLNESNSFSFDINRYFFNEFCSSDDAIDGSLLENTSCVEQGMKVENEPSVTEKQSTDSSSLMVDKLGELDKKRKVNKQGSPIISANSKEVQEIIKGKKQKKGNQVEKRQARVDQKDQKKTQEEPPTEYVHVGARRGQATDSHNLAERVRREKISERMKMLQTLVPGCDKVTGKAQVLDEIINYVQSLQDQVELLSMKLASLKPMLYNFGVATGALMFEPEGFGSMALLLPSMHQCTTNTTTACNQLTSFDGTLDTIVATAAATDAITAVTVDAPNVGDCPFLDTSSSFHHQGHKPTCFSVEDNESLYWEVGDQRQNFFNQSAAFGGNNFYSFYQAVQVPRHFFKAW